jgi:hypothetical protein
VLCDYSAGLALIDCQTDSIVVDSAMWSWHAIAHTGDGGKFYSVRGRRIEVRSSSSLALLKAIDWPYYDGLNMEPMLMYSDSTRKLYWMLVGGDSLLAIDGTSDTVTARIAASVSYGLKCFDHSGRYLFSTGLRADTCLRVFDTQTDSLVAVYDDLPTWPTSVIANPEQHRIYVGCQDVILVYPDAPPGVEEMPNAEVRATNDGSTVVSGELVLGAVGSRQHSACRAELLDVSGRKVMDLRPGANDVRALAPGVYFVRGPRTGDGRPIPAVRRVVITR